MLTEILYKADTKPFAYHIIWKMQSKYTSNHPDLTQKRTDASTFHPKHDYQTNNLYSTYDKPNPQNQKQLFHVIYPEYIK